MLLCFGNSRLFISSGAKRPPNMESLSYKETGWVFELFACVSETWVVGSCLCSGKFPERERSVMKRFSKRRNSSFLQIFITASASGGWTAKQLISLSQSTSVMIVARCFERMALSIFAIILFLRLLFLILSTLAMMFSIVPNSPISFLAATGPTPETPGMLSEESPTSPR